MDPDHEWCGGCGINLAEQGELPTADAYTAGIREQRWLTEHAEQNAHDDGPEQTHLDPQEAVTVSSPGSKSGVNYLPIGIGAAVLLVVIVVLIVASSGGGRTASESKISAVLNSELTDTNGNPVNDVSCPSGRLSVGESMTCEVFFESGRQTEISVKLEGFNSNGNPHVRINLP